MKLQDAIDTFETNFTCEQGAPWRWADLMMTKPYQLMTLDLDVEIKAIADIEHRLVARLITHILKLKSSLGYAPKARPKLWWRWLQKIRMEDGTIMTRFYIDGNPGYSKSNPQKPGGAPAAGQIRLAAGYDDVAVAA